MHVRFLFLHHPEEGVPGNVTDAAMHRWRHGYTVEVTGMSAVSREGGRDQKEKKMKPRNRKDSDARLINLSANLIFSKISRSSKHWLPVCYLKESNAKRPAQPPDKREGHTDMQSTWVEKHGCTATPCLHASCTATGLAGAGWGRDHFVISNR